MNDDEVRALLNYAEESGDGNSPIPALAAEVLRRGEVIATYRAALRTIRDMDDYEVRTQARGVAREGLRETNPHRPLTPSEQAVIDGGGP